MRLFYLDESGFSPSLPTGYSWCLPGQRKRVRYEYPQGRRVNVLATYEPHGAAPRLDALPFERTLTSDDLVAYLQQRLSASGVPRVVVLDNGSIYTSKAFKAEQPALAKSGIELYYLPAYSPELNQIDIDQPQCTSSKRWGTGLGTCYHFGSRPGGIGRPVPRTEPTQPRRSPMSEHQGQLAPPRP